MINNFSPNMLKTFQECHYKFYLKYVQKLSLPQRSIFFEKGKKIHALAHYYLQNQNIDRMEKSLTEEETTTWETLKSNKYFEYKTINTEYNLSSKINVFWIGGRLDALVENAENYYILDYKTGSVPKNAEYDFQTIVYLLCLKKYLEHKKTPYHSINFVYLGLKNNQEKVIQLNSDLENEYEKIILDICSKIDLAVKSNVFKPDVTKCCNCEYEKYCVNK